MNDGRSERFSMLQLLQLLVSHNSQQLSANCNINQPNNLLIPNHIMKLTAALPLLLVASSTAFAPSTTRSRAATPLFGYLDDLSKELYSETNNPDIDATHANTDMAKDKVDRLGPGDWSTYVEFDEFDGGDGQMGVAGDGNNVRTILIVDMCVYVFMMCVTGVHDSNYEAAAPRGRTIFQRCPPHPP
jgi:hypothetical protein